MQNIMKFIDSKIPSQKETYYIIRPEEIFELHDTKTGCLLRIGKGISSDYAEIENFRARQFKRSIQEQGRAIYWIFKN